MNPRTCAAIRELLPGYAANQLTPDERAAVEAHIATCAECRAELAGWRTLGGWLAEAEASIPPDTGVERGLAAIHARLRTPAAIPITKHSLNGFERNRRTTMTLHDRTDDDRASGAPPAPRPPYPRRIPALVAGASVALFLALVASLFYLLAPQLRGVGSGNPTATATTALTPTPPPATGSWGSVADTPAPGYAPQFAPSAPQTGYLCAQIPLGSGSSQVDSSHWLYRSDDGGQTWQTVGGIQPATLAQMSCAVFIDSANARDIFAQLVCNGDNAAPCAFLYRSRDGGATWRQLATPRGTWGWANLVVVPNGLVGLATDDAVTASPHVVACSSDPNTTDPHQINDLYGSSDGGQTWYKIGQQLISQGLSIVPGGMDGFASGWDPAPSPSPVILSAGGALFVRTFCQTTNANGDWTFHQMYWRTTDGGATWAPGVAPNSDMTLTPARAGGYYGVAVDPMHIASLASPATIMYSRDSGVSWGGLPPLDAATLAPRIKPSASGCGGSCFAQYNVPLVMAFPDGSVIAVVTGLSATSSSGEVAGVYAIDPQATHPVWRRFATGMIGAYPITAPTNGSLAATKDGLALWAVTTEVTGSDTLSGPVRIILAPVP